MFQGYVKGLLLVVILLVGWTIGQAQTRQPDFELRLVIDKQGTLLKCIRGCKLSFEANTPEGVDRHRFLPDAQFRFNCPSSNNSCTSGAIGGWVVPAQ